MSSRYTITHKDNNIPVNYPGVTTITGLIDKPFLKSWAVNMMFKYLHKNWINYVTEDAKKGFYIEFENQEDYFKMLDEAKDHYLDVSDEAKNIGTEVHDLINMHISEALGINYMLPKDLKKTVSNGFQAFLEWEKENVIRYLETEQPICSRKYGFCGTLDSIAELKPSDKIVGGIYVIDLKVSSGFYDGYGKQVAGYKIGRQECGKFHLLFKNDNDKKNIIEWEKDYDLPKINIDGIGVLRLDKETGKPDFKDYTKDIELKEKSFLKLLDFYYNDKNRRLKNNPFILKNKSIKAAGK